jgi:L-alanine-DL-glutamate epimerase-like enolase superfamily enzyme
MRLATLTSVPLHLPFRVEFAHASASRSAGYSAWVRATDTTGLTGYGESCPRHYVTGEDLKSVQVFFERHHRAWMDIDWSVDRLRQWVEDHATQIDSDPAAWAGVELALLDLLGKHDGRDVESLLNLPSLAGEFRYSAVLGDSSPDIFAAQFQHYRKLGFEDYKIKLSGDVCRERSKVAVLRQYESIRVRADANNLWRDPDQAIEHMQCIEYHFWALEEPLAAGDIAGLRQLATALDTRVVLDESVLRAEQLTPLAADAERWLINLRISKMGGLLRSMAVADAARQHGIELIVGAHVGETSVLSRAALAVVHYAQSGVAAQEGAFGTHLLQHDICASPVMFGAGGRLEAERLAVAGRPGWGIEPDQRA